MLAAPGGGREERRSGLWLETEAAMSAAAGGAVLLPNGSSRSVDGVSRIGDGPEAVRHEMGDLTATDGLRLVWRSWSPVAHPRAVLAVVHGFGEHCGRYGYLVRHAVSRGLAVHSYDLRGHGRSAGRRGHVERFGQYLDDTRVFLSRVRQKYALAPVFLVGHSMGGLVAAALAEQDDEGLAGLVLSSPFVGLRLGVSRRQERAARVFSRLLPTLSLKNPLRNEDLTSDPEALAALETDILVHRVATARWATETIAFMPEVVRAAGRLRLPLLVLYSDADPVVDPAAIEKLFDRAGSPDKSRRCYGGFRHEIFNEVGRGQVFADLTGWLEARLRARPWQT